MSILGTEQDLIAAWRLMRTLAINADQEELRQNDDLVDKIFDYASQMKERINANA